MPVTNERHALELSTHYKDYLIIPVEVERTLLNATTGDAFTSKMYRFIVVESEDCSRMSPPFLFEFQSAQDAIEVGKTFVDYLRLCYQLQVG